VQVVFVPTQSVVGEIVSVPDGKVPDTVGAFMSMLVLPCVNRFSVIGVRDASELLGYPCGAVIVYEDGLAETPLPTYTLIGTIVVPALPPLIVKFA
jgi:hypothetical protein